MKVSGKNSDLDILSKLDVASEELKSKRRSKTQKETPEESSPNEQDEIDVEDPHPAGQSLHLY